MGARRPAHGAARSLRTHRDLPEGDIRNKVSTLESIHRVITEIPQGREAFWRTFMNYAKNSPESARIVVALFVLYLHLGPFSREVMAAIDRRIAALEGEIAAPAPR